MPRPAARSKAPPPSSQLSDDETTNPPLHPSLPSGLVMQWSSTNHPREEEKGVELPVGLVAERPNRHQFVVGVDEAGTGPLGWFSPVCLCTCVDGPVAVAACGIPPRVQGGITCACPHTCAHVHMLIPVLHTHTHAHMYVIQPLTGSTPCRCMHMPCAYNAHITMHTFHLNMSCA
eukprot:GHVS01100446.1.p1 GENE.GHVS01100446.1~~GHVS01100446.1.p1  ORF type:complete len:175 (+),score=23.65 GHVS01100446.1:58-582(+)